MYRSPKQPLYSTLGKVYRRKVLTVNFDTDFVYLKFANQNAAKVLVEIDVEMLEFVVEEGVPDDKIKESRLKMASIIREAESTEIQREHLYKWQWGFY